MSIKRQIDLLRQHQATTRQTDQEHAAQAKQALIQRYQQTHVNTAAPVKSPVAPQPTDQVALKRQIRQLKHKMAQQSRQQQQKVQVLQADLQAMTTKVQRLTQQNQQLGQQVTTLTATLEAAQLDHQQLTKRLQRQTALVTTVYQYATLGRLLTERAEQRYQAADRLAQQRPKPAKQKQLSKEQQRQLSQYPGLVNRLKRVDKALALSQEYNQILSRRQKSLKSQLQKSQLNGIANRQLSQRIYQLMTPANVHLLQWLPQAAARYQTMVFDNLVVGNGQQVFGYFKRVNEHWNFITINGQAYRNYRFSDGHHSQPNSQVVYAATITGQQVQLLKVYEHVQPQELRQHHQLQLHRRRQRHDFKALLPVDATQLLMAKRVLIVTWQRTQTLSQALQSFGIQPVIVNTKEKSVPWITQQALSKRIDFTLLLSEGLSHSLLASIDKVAIKQRPDIELVYNESPEELLQRCYRFFSQSQS
ncbi:hypothetical protein [Lactiplantibacillus daowaiensis]|uniref:Uncharacterized protein n=1 Tax=Lactiplantibacillus daowaiensis TaxID=2559918 RepID=A0ABW1S2V7_9LACO